MLADYEYSPEGRPNKHIRATLAEFEREKIKERLMRGKRNKIKAGNVIVNDRPPYGYRLNEDKTSLVTVEGEAEIVRLIFQWYAWGNGTQGPLSLNAITGKLSEMGVLTAADKKAAGEQGRISL